MIALVQVTFPDLETAERIVATLLEERLAACANLTDCRSRYRWQGQVERAEEVLAQFKTLPDRAPALAARLAALHPYDLPAVEWWTAATDDAVIGWLGDEVS